MTRRYTRVRKDETISTESKESGLFGRSLKGLPGTFYLL